MQINLDPTRWLVSFAGFIVDWVMTREWSRIALSSIPLMFLVTVAGLVFWGSRLDKHKLAAHYLELGEKEIADWESSWASNSTPTEEQLSGSQADAGSKRTSTGAAQANANKTSSDQKSNAAGENGNATAGQSSGSKSEKKELSRFAEVLFRRVQLLEPNERSQFVIAVTMGQRGAVGQARKMLSKIAPDDRPGYPPAHAWIASNLLRQPITRESEPVVIHHVKQAVKWERVPEQVLLLGGQVMLQRKDVKSSIELFRKAAEINPANNLALFQLSKLVNNKLMAAEASKKAENFFRQQLEKTPNDLAARLSLIQCLAVSDRLDEAEQVILEGRQSSDTPELRRGQSEIYRLRFLRSMKQEGNNWTGDLQMLDLALRTDPTNALVGEEIAKLARLNDVAPSDELITKLQQFLAEGKATAATHAWIAELHLKRGNFKQALPHLEQVVTRLPDAAQYLNNLAFIIVEIAPDRINEALTMAQRAVQIEPSSGDFYDTLAKVLAALNRRTEAITALESAIERAPQRVDFHEGVAVLYDATGNASMAEQHRNVIKALNEQQVKQQAAQEAAKLEAAQQEIAAKEAAQPDTTQPASETNTEPIPTSDPVEPTPASESPATSSPPIPDELSMP